jgi:predicted transcriptional regulator of viral defense system
MQPNQDTLGGLSAQEREILGVLTAEERTTISADDIQEVHRCSRDMAHQILSRLAGKGWLQRLRRGLYAVVPLSSRDRDPVVENPWVVAMEVFKPSFISGWSAAEHWDLTEQVFNTVAVVTTAKQRQTMHVIGGVRFRTRTVPAERFFGDKRVWFGSTAVRIADPSRLLIDIADMPKFGGGGRHMVDVVRAYWRSDHANPQRLLDYARQYDRGSVFKRIGFLAEKFSIGMSKAWLDECQTSIAKGVTNLDPDSPHEGPIATRWNLRVNVPVES